MRRNRSPVRAVHPELIPPRLAKEIRAVVDNVRACLQSDLFPPIQVVIQCDYRESPRHFAALDTEFNFGDPAIMYLCPDLNDQPLPRIRGILYHEMGHVLQRIEKLLTGHNERHGRDTEQDADHKIEGVCGVKIYYDAQMVQQAGQGAFGFWPRPRGLR
jgi:hypothetical protein